MKVRTKAKASRKGLKARKVRTNVKAARLSANHNETLVRDAA